MDDPTPLNFRTLYISSSDTLCGSLIDQKVKEGWNDRPPLFFLVQNEENDLLLKGMIRQGVPPALRCAIWISSVVNACHPHQDQEYSDDYRTLGKVRLIDTAWDTVIRQIFPDESDLRDAMPPNLGNTDHLQYHGDVNEKGKLALTHVLCALEYIIGLEFCPLIPPLCGLFLRFMSESYAFCALREMAQNSSWYFPVTQVEHHAWCQAFCDILNRLHPATAAAMKDTGCLNPDGLAPIFKYFFLPILPHEMVMRILDIYTFEGHKVIFRFGIALLCLFKKDVVRDGMVIATPEQWWWQMREYTHSGMCTFDDLCKKAYGYHGNRVRKRLRFPRRHILARIIKLEEDKAMNEMEFEEIYSPPRPVGLIENEDIVLAKPATHRANLAKWLSPSLRLTRLDLVYSTNVHGRTLDLFYQHVKGCKQTLLLCECLDNNAIIGVFASQAWRVSNQVYGDGECFLFRLDPDPQCWKWKPDPQLAGSLDQHDDDDQDHNLETNHARSLIEQFMVGRESFISMGGNDGGGSGFRLNEDLTKGESSTARGFRNDPLPMISNFEVGIVEVYQLARSIDGKTAAQANADAFHMTL
jgi:hypothetical protein